MLLYYVKLKITKEIRDEEDVKCIVISQDIFDYSISQMIIEKKVEVIINCTDNIYNSSSFTMMKNKKIKFIFLSSKSFELFKNSGTVNIMNNYVEFKGIIFPCIEPVIKSSQMLLNSFIDNTIKYLPKEKNINEKMSITGNKINIKDYVVIISRGNYSKADIKKIKNLIRHYHPSIIAVDGGFDTAEKLKIKTDAVIGDMDSIKKKSLEKSKNIIFHCYMDGSCPAADKMPLSGKNIAYICCMGTSEDAAVLYSIKSGAKKIFTLGYHTTASDFIEKGSKGMSGYLMLRMLYGDKIVEIKGNEESKMNIDYLLYICIMLLYIITVGFLRQL